jgi:hypothetical protein
MRTKTAISFGLVDVNAKPDSTFITDDKQSFVDMQQLKRDELEIRKFATLEKDYFRLDGSFELFPDEPENNDFGLWSASMSDENGEFMQPIVLTIDFTEPHSSLGLTFTFHEPTDDYCNNLNVKWYDSSNNLLSDKSFNPDSAVYCSVNNIEGYEKLVITFYSTNKPYRYLKLTQLDFGQIKLFTGRDIINANVLEEVDPISSELRINTLNFTLYSKDAEFSILNPQGIFSRLQQRQPLKVYEYLDGVKKNIGTYYLDEWENEDEYNINMTGIDLVGVIDGTDFAGGTYNEVAAGDIIEEIMTSADAEYELDSNLASKVLSGIISACTHREALQQVVFAIGGIVDCSRSNKIKIYPMPTVISSHIGKDRKFQGHKMKLKPLVTGVEVTAHNYVDGVDYPQVFGVYNTNLAPGDKENILKVEEATLVSNSNALEVAQRIYDYYQMRHQDDGEILLQNEECGQLVTIDSLHDEKIQGIIEKLDINLTGGFIANTTITGGVQ